jgi:hypothetical protein
MLAHQHEEGELLGAPALPRPLLRSPVPDDSARPKPAAHPAARRHRRSSQYLHERSVPRSAGICRSGASRARRPIDAAARMQVFGAQTERLGRPRDLHDHGVRPACLTKPSCATKDFGRRIVPIVPDESRTFGMEGMFRHVRHLQPGRPALPAAGRRPAHVSTARTDKSGQILARGHQRGRRDERRGSRRPRPIRHVRRTPMVPFFIYYSMFGFQRIGDLAWAAGDIRSRGFLHRRDGRPHDPQRRRTAASRRPQPYPLGHGSELHLLRPGLSATRSPSSCSHGLKRMLDRPRRRVLLPHGCTTRTTSTRRCPTAPKTASSRACTWSAPRRKGAHGRPQSATPGVGRHPARESSPPRTLLGSGLRGVASGRLERHELHGAGGARRTTADRWNLLHPLEDATENSLRDVQLIAARGDHARDRVDRLT